MSKADLTIGKIQNKENTMNAVGIDVSKNKSTIAILRPFGEIVAKPFDVKHTSSDITYLISQLKSLNGDTRIVMEHTGRYYEPMAQWLSDAGLFVSAINPKLIKDFGNNTLRKVKTDKADAIKIARYTLDNWCELKPYNNTDELRRQLKNMNRQFDFCIVVQPQEVQLQQVKRRRNLWKIKGTYFFTSKEQLYQTHHQTTIYQLNTA